jgi:GNAT superfamily N-acetyltransferase
MLDVRYANADDRRFVKDSWFESYRRGGFAPEVGFDLFSEGQRKLIDYLLDLEKGDCTVLVAYPTNTPDEILGWLCFELDVLHYVYVKSAYRKMGCAAGLMERAHGHFKFYSHQTRAGVQLAKKYGFRYNPYLTMKGTGQ